jgi:tRNA threonylcarbamoyladenosine biosynthesis protein TsaE
MSTDKTLQIDSASLEETLALAKRIGSKLRGGEIIELVSDLGGGKTAFVQGLAAGIGSPDGVSSPSFTLKNVYSARNITLHHFDFYRLKDAGILKIELQELLGDSEAVVAIEWGEIVHDILPSERLTVRIIPTSELSRRFTLTCPSALAYLLQ